MKVSLLTTTTILSFSMLIANSNTNLILANNGNELVKDSSPLSRGIIKNMANLGNTFGHDKEFLRLAKDIKKSLRDFKSHNSLSNKQWLTIKNHSLGAIKGNCHAVDKLFEDNVIDNDLRKRLIKRCGGTNKDNIIKRKIKDLFKKKAAGDGNADHELNHLMEHKLSDDLLNKIHNNDEHHKDGDHNLTHNINHPHSKLALGSDPKDQAKIKEEALEYLQQNHDSIKNKLKKLDTPLSKNLLKRIDFTKRAANALMNEEPGSIDKFIETKHENDLLYLEQPIHFGMSKEMADALALPHYIEHTERLHHKKINHDPLLRLNKDNLADLENQIIPDLDSHLHSSKDAPMEYNHGDFIEHGIKDKINWKPKNTSLKPIIKKKEKTKSLEDLNQIEELVKKEIDFLEKIPDHNDELHKLSKNSVVHEQDASKVANTNNLLTNLQDTAKFVEKKLSNDKEIEEIIGAGKMAFMNVKHLGGSDKDANFEANLAASLKEKIIKDKKKEKYESLKSILLPQVGQRNFEQNAKHLVASHYGKTPTGNTIDDIVNQQKESRLEKEKLQLNEKDLGIIKVITDNVSEISANNSVLDLPVSKIPTAKAETLEEETVKSYLADLRDKLRNKITKNTINSGLVTLNGLEGILNLPESCQEVVIKKGKVIFDQAGYDSMKAERLDTSPLVHKYSKEDMSIVYEGDLKNMKMKLPNIINQASDLNRVYNDYESFNIKYAKQIQIANGFVKCQPWKDFSNEVKPKVYKAEEEEAEKIPDEVKRDYERIEKYSKDLEKTKIKLLRNPEGELVAEVEPTFGIKRQMPLKEALEEARKLKQQQKEEDVTQADRNHKKSTGKSKNIRSMSSIDKAFETAITRLSELDKQEQLNFLQKSNLKSSITYQKEECGIVAKINEEESNKHEEMKLIREGEDTATVRYNMIVLNSDKIANKLGMKKEDFVEKLKLIDKKVFEEAAIFLKEAVKNPKKALDLEKQGFSKIIKEHFSNLAVYDVINILIKKSGGFSISSETPDANHYKKHPNHLNHIHGSKYNPAPNNSTLNNSGPHKNTRSFKTVVTYRSLVSGSPSQSGNNNPMVFSPHLPNQEVNPKLNPNLSVNPSLEYPKIKQGVDFTTNVNVSLGPGVKSQFLANTNSNMPLTPNIHSYANNNPNLSPHYSHNLPTINLNRQVSYLPQTPQFILTNPYSQELNYPNRYYNNMNGFKHLLLDNEIKAGNNSLENHIHDKNNKGKHFNGSTM